MVRKYKTDLEEARQKLADLFRQREALEVKIARQQRNVAALATLADESEEADVILEMNMGGLTEACCTVLRAAGVRGLTPLEVRQELRNFHFPIDDYKSAIASIHTVLKRLDYGGKVRAITRDLRDGKGPESAYQWIGGKAELQVAREKFTAALAKVQRGDKK